MISSWPCLIGRPTSHPAAAFWSRSRKRQLAAALGIFLFTQDDELTDRAHKDKAVPRDNVVFEAGYFTNSKGKDHVLIVREAGAKMPADLGGDIYASLEDKSKIAPIKETIRRFIDGL